MDFVCVSEDNNLVHGVQKLLQMFQNDSAGNWMPFEDSSQINFGPDAGFLAAGFGVVPTGVPPPGVGLLGHQVRGQLFAGLITKIVAFHLGTGDLDYDGHQFG